MDRIALHDVHAAWQASQGSYTEEKRCQFTAMWSREAKTTKEKRISYHAKAAETAEEQTGGRGNTESGEERCDRSEEANQRNLEGAHEQ